jgi:PAS domain S-box-containing protein
MPTIPIEDLLADPVRLAALEATHLLDSPPEAVFDRYTRLAARLLHVPTTLMSLVAADRQFFKSIGGRPEAWTGGHEGPLTQSFCRYVVVTGAPLIISDARIDPVPGDSLPHPDPGVLAYAGMPIVTPDGQTIGAFCAIDSEPHNWTADEVEILADLAASLHTEIALRMELERQNRTAAALRESETRFRTFIESLGEGLLITDLDDRVLYVNQRMTELSGFSGEDLLGRPAYERLLPPAEWPQAQGRNARRRAGQADTYTIRMVQKDGTPWWAAVTATPLRNADGAIIGTMGAISDVTARMAVEADRDRLLIELQTALGRMEALYTVSTQITNIEDLDHLLHTVADLAARILPADRVTVALLAAAAHQVTHLVAGGPGADHVATVDYAELLEGLTGWVLRTGHLANSPKGAPDPRESREVQARRAATACGAILVAPLSYQGQVIGTITAINQPDQPDFAAADEHVLGALAGQAAVALAQARLYQTAQHRPPPTR